MAIHNREFDDERCKNCFVNAKCLSCDVYLEPTITELEKIKAEIDVMYDSNQYSDEFEHGIMRVREIINEHIFESRKESEAKE